MTNTYLIHAWCNRPFIACMSAQASSPARAIAIARRNPKALKVTAEECNGQYPEPIIIEVRGGIVQDVRNVPPGYQVEIRDYDCPEPDAA